jgi:hypothetical protein
MTHSATRVWRSRWTSIFQWIFPARRDPCRLPEHC